MEEDTEIIKKEAKIVAQDEKDKKAEELRLTMRAERKKVIALDVLVGITIFIYFLRFVFFPYVLHIFPDEYKALHKVLKNHYGNVFKSWFNILLFLIFIGLLSVYFSFNNIDFKHMGIILIIAYITSLAVEAKLFITGAVLNAIVVYIYVRILLLKNKETIEEKRKRERERRIVDEIREINESWINYGN